MATPRSTKGRTFSGVAEMSVATTTTSVQMPASNHSLAVSSPALPDAHIAVTPMHGPWNLCSRITVVSGVEGISSMYCLRVRRMPCTR